MNIGFSVRCGLPEYRREGEQQAWLFIALRLSILVLGAIAVIVGILALAGVSGLSLLGTIGGSSILSAGAFALLLGTFIQCVKSEDLSQKLQSENRRCLENGLNSWVNASSSKENCEEAARRILNCFDQRGIDLDLSLFSLTSLPSKIGQLSQLRKLWLFRNQLISLPLEIGQLSQLRELWLFGNQLTFLPPEIGQLSQLRELNLHSNQLGYLPPEIGQLSQLRELNLSGNQLISLPPEISQLSQLRKLDLSDIQLISLPPEIGQLSQLRELWLYSNQLISLPSEIGQLSQLKNWWMNDNQLGSLPPETSQLSQLQELMLSRNRFISLPPEIGQLSQLRKLWLSSNQLISLPPEIGQLSQLRELDLDDNQLTGLPNSIFNLGTMCKVNIEENPFSQSVLDNLQAAVNQSNYQGPRFCFSIQDRRQDSQFQSIEDSLNSLSKLAEKEIIKLQNLENNETLRSWLSRLVDVKDYQGPTRKQLAKKIYDAIILAEKDEIFRAVFLNCIKNASETCGDRMALSILYIGLNLQIHKSEDLGELAYLLGHGTIALRELETTAQNKVESLRFVDEIEVYLAYPVKLKEKLQLPIDIESMLFFNFSSVTDDDLSIAEGIVRAILSNKKTYCQRLVENTIWQDAIDKHYPQYKKKRDEDYKRGVDWKKTKHEYEEAILQVTQQILEDNPPPFLKPQEEGSSQLNVH